MNFDVSYLFGIALLVLAGALFVLAKLRWDEDTPGPGIVGSVSCGVLGLTVFIVSWGSRAAAVSDTEYLNQYVTYCTYYEDWDEWITETCQKPCGTDEKGNTKYCTVDCSYRKYHPEYWTVTTADDQEHDVSEDRYNHVVSKLKSKRRFLDMHRDYYREDGDAYQYFYEPTSSEIVPYVWTQSYTNKVQAAKDVFNYPDVSPEEKSVVKPFEYPDVQRYGVCTGVLTDSGVSSPTWLNYLVDSINSVLGPRKQVRLWLLLTREDRGAGFA